MLFERESQTNAKKAAQRKYRQILQEAGVADDVVDSLVTEDGQIIDAESDDEFAFDDEVEDSSLRVDGDKADSPTFLVDEENERGLQSKEYSNDAKDDDGLNTTHTLSVEDASDNDKSL